MPSLSVILSTFNQPDWLEKTLWGYAAQSDRDFQLLIADDGSDPPTKAILEKIRAETPLRPLHIWHPHHGFQKSAILNQATVAADGTYLLYSDGDCVPRSDFVAAHRRFAQPGHFLSGGYTKLPLPLSQQITPDDIACGRAFDPKWLSRRGLPYHFWHKHAARRLAPLWNALTPTKATWNGHSASGWKEDILKVNGYNEDMQYGGQDRELGERLTNAGITGIRIRYFAITLHLDHPRAYATPESKAKNRAIRQTTVSQKLTWTPRGIQK
jgi:glycosyltransferase involved in cell wall biosynthesis